VSALSFGQRAVFWVAGVALPVLGGAVFIGLNSPQNVTLQTNLLAAIVIAFFLIFAVALVCLRQSVVTRACFQVAVVLGALALLFFEREYFSNRHALGVVANGRIFDKIWVDDCFMPQVPSNDPVADRDWSEAVSATCGPWVAAHYAKYAAILLVTVGAVVLSYRRKPVL
jgi:hypothetical protein